MKIATLSVCSLLLSTSLAAQATMKTLTPVGVYARQGSRADFHTIAAGTTVAAGASTSVAARVHNSHAATLINWQLQRSGIVTASLSEQGGVAVAAGEADATVGTTGSPRLPSVQGPHSVVLKIRGRAGSIALIEAWATGGLSAPSRGVSGSYQMDLGNNGSVEFKAGLIGHSSTAFPIKFPASGVLIVKLQSEAKATQHGRGGVLYKSGMSFRMRPGPFCVALPYGDSCGPRLAVKTGATTTGDYLFGMSYSNATANSRHLLIVGDRRVNIRIPGIHCALLTRPVVVVPFKTNSRGVATWQFKVPRTIPVNAQVQGCDLRTAKASNGVHVICLR